MNHFLFSCSTWLYNLPLEFVHCYLIIIEHYYFITNIYHNIRFFAGKSRKLTIKHNIENCMVAIMIAKEYNISNEVIVDVISNFKGVEHRLEFVREINHVKWYNDSVSSSPTRTIAGLNSYDERIVLIAGGYDKNLDYTPIAKPILEHVNKLILFGATSQKIYDAVISAETNESIQIYREKTLQDVVSRAKEVAIPGEIVLFSPASASFDMFKNFADRGKQFKDLVNKL